MTTTLTRLQDDLMAHCAAELRTYNRVAPLLDAADKLQAAMQADGIEAAVQVQRVMGGMAVSVLAVTDSLHNITHLLVELGHGHTTELHHRDGYTVADMVVLAGDVRIPLIVTIQPVAPALAVAA